jgi:sugar phosphate isomerase/epimerase
MHSTLLRLAGVWLALATGLFADPAASAPRLFFAFDNGVGREAGWSPERQATLLARLGYQGIGYTGVDNHAARQAAFRGAGLRIVSVYVPCRVDATEAYSPALISALPQLRESGTLVWLTVQGRASDDARAATIVHEIASAAARHGVQVVLYPHKGFHIATADDALRLVRRVALPNLGLSFNLAHELAAGHADRVESILTAIAPHLMLVSINGADRAGGWTELIQPLDAGNFDVRRVLRTLDTIGYRGPVGLQCYAIPGEPEPLLTRSIRTWHQLTAVP